MFFLRKSDLWKNFEYQTIPIKFSPTLFDKQETVIKQSFSLSPDQSNLLSMPDNAIRAIVVLFQNSFALLLPLNQQRKWHFTA